MLAKRRTTDLQHKLDSVEVWAYDRHVRVVPIPLEVGLEQVW